jgi:two-component system chemotaxis response regulator CheB
VIGVVVAARSPDDRELLIRCLGGDRGFALLASVALGRDAVSHVRRLRPDIVLLDASLSGPTVDEVTREIMIDVPTPIMVLLASADRDGAERARAALEAGALVTVQMPRDDTTRGASDYEPELVTMTKAMAGVKVVKRRPTRGTPASAQRGVLAGGTTRRPRLVVIASSTGGPAALRTILSELPVEFPAPVLVVQHIARDFVGMLVEWIDGLVRVRVRVAAHGQTMVPGTIYFAPDDMHLGVHGAGTVRLSTDDNVGGFRPSATHLFESAASAFGRDVLAVVLTGMGSDGVAGLHAVRNAGGQVLAQDEASSVVFGMPGEAARAGLVDEMLPVHLLGRRIIQLVMGEPDDVA